MNKDNNKTDYWICSLFDIPCLLNNNEKCDRCSLYQDFCKHERNKKGHVYCIDCKFWNPYCLGIEYKNKPCSTCYCKDCFCFNPEDSKPIEIRWKFRLKGGI